MLVLWNCSYIHHLHYSFFATTNTFFTCLSSSSSYFSLNCCFVPWAKILDSAITILIKCHNVYWSANRLVLHLVMVKWSKIVNRKIVVAIIISANIHKPNIYILRLRYTVGNVGKLWAVILPIGTFIYAIQLVTNTRMASL